jgi:hypothetical protein
MDVLSDQLFDGRLRLGHLLPGLGSDFFIG